jgi:broad specificity phosphatase PhoE
MTVVLVRHAEPDVVAGVDPRQWVLSMAGRRAARGLRERLPRFGVWVSSTEAKAHETLVCAGGGRVAVAQDARLDEVHRYEPFDQEFRARRLAWVEGHLDQRHAGWETPSEAADRFDRAIDEHAADGKPVVVGSHGMVMTAWLVRRRQVVAPKDAGSFWEALAFPDVIRVE